MACQRGREAASRRIRRPSRAEPFEQDGGPALIVRAGSQFGYVVRGGIRPWSANLTNVVDVSRTVAGAAVDTRIEETAASIARLDEINRETIERLLAHLLGRLLDDGEIVR